MESIKVEELYEQTGDSIGKAHRGLQLRARRAADDIKDYFHSINFDIIRKTKEDRFRRQQP